MKKIKINPFLFFLSTIIYLEIIIKSILCKNVWNIGLIYMAIFLIPIIILLTLLTKSFLSFLNKIILFITTILLTIYFEVQFIFYELFSVPFSFSTIGLVDQAFDFVNIIKDVIVSNFLYFLLILIPLFILSIFHKKIDTKRYSKYEIISLLCMFLTSYGFTFLILIPNKKEFNSPYKLYYHVDDAISIIDTFGMINYSKIDLKRQFIEYDNELILDLSEEEKEELPEEVKEYGLNVLDLNLEDKKNEIGKINQYVENQTPTNKSSYTGMFKGKNLIFILAEGFNEIAVDENRTPTLYKLTNNGFVFNNFYSPVFLSTTGGEFQATTGLIPTQETLKLWKSKSPTISFALGNAFQNIGYRAQSYHDWTYTYYKRQVTMGTLGFSNYLGCGNGLEKRIDCNWLPKDSDMINETVGDYLNQEGNFVTYYVTVSGHSPYSAGDNIAKLHFDTVKDTNYSNSVKYYLASQVELDKMLETLIKKLEESGQLDNTVIALVGDHYPYTLSETEMNEVSTYYKDSVVEVNHSNFILWNNEIEEPIQINKVGSQIDVLPTLLNLFGIEYDSRTIIGKDILSEQEGLAIFSDHSWVSDYGTYQARARTFTKKEGVELEDEASYIARINNRVTNAFSVSKLIISNNYYSYLKENS